MELEIFLHGVDVVEDIVDDSGNNALHAGVVDDPLHGVSLPAGSLTVRKYCSIVPVQNI